MTNRFRVRDEAHLLMICKSRDIIDNCCAIAAMENSEKVGEKSNEEVTIENVSFVIKDNSDRNKNGKINKQNEGGDNRDKNSNDKRISKRSLVVNNTNELDAKKPRWVNQLGQEESPQNQLQTNNTSPSGTRGTPILETLSSFSNFMKCPKMGKKLTRSDLEEIVIQKISEVLVLKSPQVELFQGLKRMERDFALLHKDVQQLQKQHLELLGIIKQLLAKLETQKKTGVMKRPEPLKRSVGLQVRLDPDNQQAQQRTAILTQIVRQVAPKLGQVAAVRKVLNSTPKPPPGKTLRQTNSSRHQEVAQKTNLFEKPADLDKKTAAFDFIDLTDDSALAHKPAANFVQSGTFSAPNKRVPSNDTKAGFSGSKSLLEQALPPNKLIQGIRLTPASNATKSPLPSNAGWQQKVALVTFQPNKIPSMSAVKDLKHPAPLPVTLNLNFNPSFKLILPKPKITIRKIDVGIVLEWKMPYKLDLFETIASYQVYAYQVTTSLPSTEMWKKVGDVRALPLPMTCTLTHFTNKNKFFFAVRAIDVRHRIGAFSDPQEISF